MHIFEGYFEDTLGTQMLLKVDPAQLLFSTLCHKRVIFRQVAGPPLVDQDNSLLKDLIENSNKSSSTNTRKTAKKEIWSENH
jgi:hypothetical protein